MSTHSLCGNDVILLFAVEASNSFDRHVIAFGCTRGENYVLLFGPYDIRDVLAVVISEDYFTGACLLT